MIKSIPLKPYQKLVENFIMRTPKCGVFLDMGAGKACDDATPVMLHSGKTKPIGEVMPGDLLLTPNGTPAFVSDVFHHRNKAAYRITLDDGRSYISCDEHLTPYLSDDDAIEVKALQYMLRNYKSGSRIFKYYIPTCKPINFHAKNHNIPPFVMGVLLARGMLQESSLVTTALPKDCLSEFCKQLGIPASNVTFSIDGARVRFSKHWNAKACRDQLRYMGIDCTTVHTRYIPEEYLIDSIENRRQLLNGIMLAAGSVRVTANATATEYMTFVSPKFAEDFRTLCCGLGIPVRLRQNRWGLTVSVYAPEPLLPADRLPRRVTRYASHRPGTAIVDIQPVAPRNMTCLTVMDQSHMFLLGDYIVTHNTAITLDSIRAISPAYHVLICAPKNIARSTWIDEMRKWEMNFRWRSLIVNEKGKQLSKKKRLELYDSIRTTPPAIWFINRELICDLVAYMTDDLKHPERWPFGMIILDESQGFKSYKSQRFKILSKVTPYTQRVIELTGTPRPHDLSDLWSQIYLLDNGQRLGKNITAFRSTYFNMVPNLTFPLYNVKPGAEDAVYARIKDIVISMKNMELKLPPLTYNTYKVYMDPKEESYYKQMMKEQVLPLIDGTNIVASTAGVLFAKLWQMASGALYTDKNHNFIKIHERKLEMCAHIIHNTGSPCIVAYHFQSDREMLYDYLKKEKIDVHLFDGSPEMQHEWNAGKYQAILLQPASCGHGLNLQQGGHTLIWYSIPSSLEEYLQTNKRLHRTGQTDPVMIHHLITAGTVDETNLKNLNKKDIGQAEMLEAVNYAVRCCT